MMIAPKIYLRKIVVMLLFFFWFCYLPTMTLGKSFFDDKIINRPTDHSGVFPFTNAYPYRVYLISNIAEQQVMPLVCAAGLQRTAHCHYLPLNSLGSYGKKHNELLPYDEFSPRHMLITVLNRAEMSTIEKANVEKIRRAHFSQTSIISDQKTIFVRIDNVGKSGKEYNVWIDLPRADLLTPLMVDLRALPDDTIADKSKKSYQMQSALTRTAVLCDDENINEIFRRSLPYSDTITYPVSKWQQFRTADDIDMRIIALNWNSSFELTLALATQLLPQIVIKEINAPITGTELTNWQFFCQRAIARRIREDTKDSWLIAAPSAALLRQLATQVTMEKFPARDFEIPLVNLTRYKTFSVVVSLTPQDPDPRRLVLQDQMEASAQRLLQGKMPLADGEMMNHNLTGNLIFRLSAREITPVVTVTHRQQRLTPLFPEFSDSEPDKPHCPDPDDKVLFSGRKYKMGKNDPQFKEDLDYYYRVRLPEYERKHREWERDKKRWQRDYDSYRVNYEYDILLNPQVALSGMLQLIDQNDQRTLPWSSEIHIEQRANERVVMTIPVVVYGEDQDPATPREIGYFSNHFGWSDYMYDNRVLLAADSIYSLGASALQAGLEEGLQSLLTTALWPGDLQPWNRPGARIE